MENSPLFDGIRQEWEARAEKRGEKKGEKKGAIKGMQEMLFELVEAKFGALPDELRSRLGAMKEQEVIKMAIRKALSSDTIQEYLSKLEH